MRRPSFNSSTFMSGIFVSSLTAARAMKNSSKIACAGNTNPEKISFVFPVFSYTVVDGLRKESRSWSK